MPLPFILAGAAIAAAVGAKKGMTVIKTKAVQTILLKSQKNSIVIRRMYLMLLIIILVKP
ncbi:hypothetical protein PY247_00530 [Acinetobacter proteolyticus]|nr:hypothetical protein [Acinetobacter proteolyticus]WEI18744.1 hypothetical protein PY247_00530 [Acinetobacter proteolyticus]